MINQYKFWDTYNPIHTEFNNFSESTSDQNLPPEQHEDIKDIINIWENIYSDQKIKNQGSTSETIADSLALIKKTIELLNGYYSLLGKLIEEKQAAISKYRYDLMIQNCCSDFRMKEKGEI